ncbi:sulfatase domain-containing protein [Hirsutella rhossiliensis]|uniref:Sulfatase domain-containing protein n=1 Tax=Hirsutella rhossiliensis TaxID=111463 RepID=A0A9P8SE54_9HYPO|nr:sulfatase domain-containing protein [Hirsutella rhossiliensis]KAH0958609.1 sulfatase domain-containing protein [Hirsutella rhossiliensis]
MAFATIIGIGTITFFVVAGSEIHWSNVGVAGDAAGRALLLSGVATLVPVLGALCLISWLLQDFFYGLGSVAADIVSWPLNCASRAVFRHRLLRSQYAKTPQHDPENGQTTQVLPVSQHHVFSSGYGQGWHWMSILWLFAYAIVAGGLLAQAILCFLRPNESALTFMSWTPALLPFVDFQSSSLHLLSWPHGSGALRDWDNRTALAPPTPLSWLPKDTVLPGFEDWYGNKTHYNAAADPLRISNLDDELLLELRNVLRDVPIRHIMCIVLESTRQDLFPIKENGIPLQRLRETWSDGKLPREATEHLESLTPTAKLLTGDFDDGFQRQTPKDKPRGGISYTDAYTTSTYTLKSLVGTLCGISPLVADFNVEHQHHFYNPCLPHVLDALNTLGEVDSRDFTSYKWKSSFLQTATLDFDNFGPLVGRIGFSQDAIIDREYLRGSTAKFGPVTLPDVNYFGFEEDPLGDYIRDAFSAAKENDERVFLTHVTSTSHHPWALPGNERHVQLANGLDDLSHYINTIGYDDRWLGKILEILDDQGVADETLVVLLGDHGLSIPENDNPSSNFNPNVGNNHVPLILSHPKIPPLTIDDAVSSQQVLPTVLDLLIETGSLAGKALQAAKDLIRNYEGQSLVRPLRKSSSTTGDQASSLANWHFTVINPGRSMVGVRDARQKSWRLVVPTVDNIEWRFSDLATDPREAKPVVGFDLKEFLARIHDACGSDAAQWVEDAVFVTRWWVEENSKRWRYGSHAE